MILIAPRPRKREARRRKVSRHKPNRTIALRRLPPMMPTKTTTTKLPLPLLRRKKRPRLPPTQRRELEVMTPEQAVPKNLKRQTN